MDEMICWIDGFETEVEVESVDGPTITTEDGREFLLFENHDEAEKEVRDRWESMDIDELKSRVDIETIVDYWWRGSSFASYVDDRVSEGVEFELAGYDHIEHEFESEHDELWEFKLAYRTE